MSGVEVIVGDCLEVMHRMAEESVDSIVTDPPYGLEFMGKEWDHGIPGVRFWAEALRVAKPGAHLLAFGGTRTFHRLACAIEDAGWEIRDCIMWVYGSGFPKSLDVSKAIDKAAGAERKVVGRRTDRAATPKQDIRGGNLMNGVNGGIDCSAITAPATGAAREWSGWGTALKPSWEPVIVARKPLIGTVVENVLKHGVGAINVDGCRVPTEDNLNGGAYSGGARPTSAMGCTGEVGGTSSILEAGGGRLSPAEFVQPPGRWPANLVHDGSEEVVELFPKQKSGLMRAGVKYPGGNVYGAPSGVTKMETYVDAGSAARFFYCAKASQAERTCGGQVDNRHPTVKPVALMRWLVRLVTRKGGLVLDPFCGSGSTGIAARAEGMQFLGIEQDPENAATARARLAASVPAQGDLL